MSPLSWVYMTINRDSRSQSFIMALMVLPICVASIVLLIQDNLLLAFGLIALVAAVRFQLPLGNVLDGTFVPRMFNDLTECITVQQQRKRRLWP